MGEEIFLSGCAGQEASDKARCGKTDKISLTSKLDACFYPFFPAPQTATGNYFQVFPRINPFKTVHHSFITNKFDVEVMDYGDIQSRNLRGQYFKTSVTDQ
jgi:hypothetical protein